MKTAWLCRSCAQMFGEHYSITEITVPRKINGKPIDKKGCEQCKKNKKLTVLFEIGDIKR